MKFNVAGKAFQQQLVAVSKVINSKNALSILDNFLLTVEGDLLTITGSDQENTMSASLVISEVDGEGSVAVSARRMLDIFKEVTGQALTFYVNDENFEIDIKFLNGHFKFNGLDPRDYPCKAPHEEDARSFTMPAPVLISGIENTIFAVSAETIRPVMTGIYWDIHEHDITFVSSDTHKLVKFVNSNIEPGLIGSFIMPAKPANILRSLLAKEDIPVEVTFDSKGATFKFADYSLTTKFIKGNYPNYDRVIPRDNPFTLEADRESFLTAMRRVALFASAASSLVRLNIQHQEVIFSSQDLDYATSAEERMTCDYNGTPMTMGFNAQYLIEVLGNLHSSTIYVKLSDPSRPGLFVPAEQEPGEEDLVLVMPMQVLD